MIINAGIKEVVYHQEYSIAHQAFDLLHEAGVNVRPLED
jgi:dCMP deaminase